MGVQIELACPGAGRRAGGRETTESSDRNYYATPSVTASRTYVTAHYAHAHTHMRSLNICPHPRVPFLDIRMCSQGT